MGKFLKKLERFLVNLIVICLILVITSQLIIKKDLTWQRFSDLRVTFKELFLPEREAVPVSTIEQAEEGTVVIQLVSKISLPQVWLLKNGKKEVNFKEGSVVCTVKEGDLLTIDARNYSDPLWYEVRSITSNIKSLETEDLFRTADDTTSLGVVEFKDGKL